MVNLFCWICGNYSPIERCHVKDKDEFTDEQKQDKFDEVKNIIIMCKAHHKLFDNKKAIGIVKLEEKNYYFTRINHCYEGICATESKEPMINEFLRELGHDDPSMINPTYIKEKNGKLADIGHQDFTRQETGTHIWKKCENIEEN